MGKASLCMYRLRSSYPLSYRHPHSTRRRASAWASPLRIAEKGAAHGRKPILLEKGFERALAQLLEDEHTIGLPR